jgi:uncharacterized protein YndB with AHSA1/START domain
MKGQQRFEQEYELRASVKILYPYISTASGLANWFADKVKMVSDHEFVFTWDGIDYPAELASSRINKFVKFEFKGNNTVGDIPSFIEIRLESNDLTNSTFLHIIDYSNEDSPEDLEMLWESSVQNLKDVARA